MVSQIRAFMENNKYLRKAVPIIRNKSILLRYRSVLRCRKLKEGFRQFYELHAGELEKVEQMLADDFSRRTLRTIIAARLDPKLDSWGGVVVAPQYFLPEIFGPVKDEVFVDGGAYNGDTILSFIETFGKGRDYYKKVYAWEPDADCCDKLARNCKGHKNIEVLPYGMWDKKEQLTFSASGFGWSSVGKGDPQRSRRIPLIIFVQRKKSPLSKWTLKAAK